MNQENSRQAYGPRRPFWIEGFDLLACLAGFSAAVWLYGGLAQGQDFAWSMEKTREVVVSSLTAWVAIASTGNPWGDGVRLWVDRLFSAIGFNLIFQYGLAYAFHIAPTPWPVAVAGCILAVALIAAFQRRSLGAVAENSGGTLLLGYDSLSDSLLPALGRRVVGVLDSAPRGIPAERLLIPPVLGDLSRFEDVMASERPARVVVNTPAWSSAIPPRRLLALRRQGVIVEDAPALFENVLKRVRWPLLDPLDLLLSPRLSINRSAIALQAVYTNVFGLALLVLFSPILLLAALLVALTTAAFPLESPECLGFQRMPFRPLRFRTRLRNGKPSWSGTLLTKLHLVNLPQLVNVVRGEMALFGPPPARKEFALRLSELIPVYAHRFIVKPGMMGWSQANLASAAAPQDESLRLEYDLYYIREESPSLDLDILFRTFFRAPLRVGANGRGTA